MSLDRYILMIFCILFLIVRIRFYLDISESVMLFLDIVRVCVYVWLIFLIF